MKSVEEELLEAIDIEEFFDWMGLDMKRGRSEYRGPCPLHNGEHRNLQYKIRTGYFTCHSRCKGIGNVIWFYAKLKGISKEGAIRELAKWKGIKVGKKKMFIPFVVENKCVQVEEKTLVQTLPTLPSSETHGLIPLTEHFRFSQKVLTRFSVKKGIRGRYWNRSVFPIYDLEGRWIGNSGRWEGEVNEETIRYLYSPEPFLKSHVLYGMHLAKTSPCWILHEGVTDVASAYTHGVEAIATLGADLSIEQAELLRQHPKPIVIAFDGDEAGKKATHRAIKLLTEKHLPLLYVMVFPDGKDPGDVSMEEYHRLLATKIPAMHYLRQYPLP
ncbi:toprim domain-containing protein [Cytobacillus sp. FJAT-54145]|uniref:Toprim domain-containing protein n=1 Tax=Cytobacillus spartinae TaxID=3299023 RepID=A0ABW6KBJ4_9BACI